MNSADKNQEHITSETDDTTLKNNQTTVTMIESMLMTAKRFGYSTVLFENAGLEEVGPYHLFEPIDVPLAVNPIDIQAES